LEKEGYELAESAEGEGANDGKTKAKTDNNL
jgi:hypothetical protein